jgi:hypothetical protein
VVTEAGPDETVRQAWDRVATARAGAPDVRLSAVPTGVDAVR